MMGLLIYTLMSWLALDSIVATSSVKPLRQAFGHSKMFSHPLQSIRYLDRQARKAITDEEKHWPDGVIPYRFDQGGDFSREDEMTILAAMDVWSADTCIAFRLANPDDKDFVLITNGDYCWSYIGRKGGQQLLILQKKWCRNLQTVLHELGHAIGLHHEHSRPDRNEYIQILWDNISEQDKYNFETALNTNPHGAPYDFHSIMHYRNKEFSKERGKNTIQALKEGEENMGRYEELSFYDVRTVSLMYKCYQKCGVYIPALACRMGTAAFMGKDCHCYSLETYSSNIIIV